MPDGTDLPLQDYDQLSLGTLRHAIRSLDRDQLEQLLEYERSHADRVPVKQLLATRIEEVAAGAAPSPGGPPAGSRPTGRIREGDLPVRPGMVTPDTAAPPSNPPPHGVPSNAPSRRHDQG